MSSLPSTSSMESLNSSQKSLTERLRNLYRAVDETDTPLPRSWSPKDKYSYIGLSYNDLRVHYKGVGKTTRDAASVRATHPIPAACGIYYFEIKVISKGRDGYMGIGLSTQGVNTNKLPGWEKHSYGYHGDDGHSFCSASTGVPYGPTFTTGDVIGCCLNLIDNSCFYTKNGVNLGIAFCDLPHNLYPTVGLQTPGEVVEANFGQQPFVFDIEDYMKEWHRKTKQTIELFPIEDKKGEWQAALQKIVSTYLVHHGYCATAEAFARSAGQAFEEELVSIKNRQRIQKLVLAGRIGEAIDTTHQLYPGLLERNANLLFMLKCRQFIEMVNGTDSEVRGAICSPRGRHGSGSSRSSPSMSPVHHSVRVPLSGTSSPIRGISSKNQGHTSGGRDLRPVSESNPVAVATNGADADIDMDGSDGESISNGTTNGSCMNGAGSGDAADMDVDHPRKQMCGGSQAAIEKMLLFGRELNAMSIQLKRENGKSETNKKALQNAFSLLAYADPWSSPVGYQLDPVQREPVCAALNSAILESHGLPKQPPLELAINQASECMSLMAKSGIGSCAFASVDNYLH